MKTGLTEFLAKLIGLYCLLVALSMMVQKDAMVTTVSALFQDRPALILAGVIGLGVGLAMVLGHNVWSGGALPVVITVVGWLSVLKGLVLLSFPPGAEQAYFTALHYQQFFYAYTGFTLLLGAYLTYGGFSSAKLQQEAR